MNIFATYSSPERSAIALDDKRVIKMAVESAQLLSTAIFLNDGDVSHLYKPTHIHHPCTIWVSKNKQNWMWLYHHLIALCDEYTFRFGKTHKTSELITPLLEQVDCLKKTKRRGKFVNCARNESYGLDFSDIADTKTAYRRFLAAKWKRDTYTPKWTGREKPDWAESNLKKSIYP